MIDPGIAYVDGYRFQTTLDQYIDLIKSFYGYTSHDIVNNRERGVISPRYYVVVKFD